MIFMLNGWLIYTKSDALDNSSYIDWFIQEAKLQNINLKLIFRENITISITNNQTIISIDGTQVKAPHFAVARTIDTTLSFHLESCNIRVFNPGLISQLVNHKSWTYQTIQKLKIPIVDTIFTHSSLLTNKPPFCFPFVIKESAGRSGKQVFLINNKAEWDKQKKKINEKDVVIQSANVQFGKDLRVFIIGKDIIGAVLRDNENDFRANFKLGGTAIWYELSPNEKKLIEVIIEHFSFDMVGIDFLIDHHGQLLFNEIEDVVGSRILSEVSHINLLKKYVTYIKKTLGE